MKAPLLPVRGLVPLYTRDGHARAAVDLRRWLRLSRVVYKCAKADLFDAGYHHDLLRDLCAEAVALDIVPSLRTACEAPPGDLAALRDAGLQDLCLSPGTLEAAALAPWLEAAAAAGIPLRLHLPAGSALLALDPACEALLLAAKPVTVHGVVGDPFCKDAPCRDAAESQSALANLVRFAEAAQAAGSEVSLVGVPLEHLPESLHPCAMNAWQAQQDHQGYNAASLALAEALYDRKPHVAATALLALLARRVSRLSQLDNFVLARTLHKREGLLSLLAGLHKLTRLRGELRGVPAAMAEGVDAFESNTGRADGMLGTMAPVEIAAFQKAFPGLPVSHRVAALRWGSAARPRYFDAVDAARRDWPVAYAELARKAQRIVQGARFDREILPSQYGAENAHTMESPSANRWCSIANVEKRSTQLGLWEPPLTLQVTVGGGHAEYAGFAFGAHARVLCPMDGFDHTLTLHVAADGHYVLLRDGAPVRPVEFAGRYFVPTRLAGRLDPRLALWNIDKDIFTQAVLVWEHAKTPAQRPPVKYSVVLVTTRYARRLQATLLSLASQRDFDLSQMEVIVANVPGIDGTDDVIDSMQAAFPALRIVRSPFSEADAKSKGMLINESVKLAVGEWVVLLDSDIVLLPETFAQFEAHADGAHFMAPDGRKMLDPATTAHILLGLIDPAAEAAHLLSGPGEWRRREAGDVPIGFCQAVRRACFERVQYEEHGHFEGADWRFAQAIRDAYGPETWLEGLPAFHLDHGASNWYGTKRHY